MVILLFGPVFIICCCWGGTYVAIVSSYKECNMEEYSKCISKRVGIDPYFLNGVRRNRGFIWCTVRCVFPKVPPLYQLAAAAWVLISNTLQWQDKVFIFGFFNMEMWVVGYYSSDVAESEEVWVLIE